MIDQAEPIFLAALDRATPRERAAYVEGACTGQPELLQRVQALLASHEASSGPLDAPPPGLGATAGLPPIAEGPGTRIGDYKLLQQIGEGGMGVVYMAEQQEPVRRKVALKIIKPGMDSAQVLARFEAERQALAMMDHQNIAKIFDAGTTDAGRPYFVMELVQGVPITSYCDKNQLTPRDRLALFIPVCQAIQHAHQKGVIHRDIKPSNVLVALCDGKPVPKVIDFGIAKATNQQLTDKTLFTRHGQIVGTFEYMSPEQATLDSLDVDTRSDIYSLCVLLYELLTGTTPLDKDRLRQAALDEILRLIREEEPPRPSNRLSASGECLPMIAAYRGTNSQKLPSLLRGDLDWIVMKGLDKDRTRRYETALGLADDVRRYLNEEAVEARPPSTAYRLRKFIKRNRTPVVAAAVVLLAVLAGIAGTTWGWLAASSQRDDALLARSAEAEQRQLALANAAEAKTNEQIAQDEARKAKEAGDEARRLAKQEEEARKLADEERRKAQLEKEKAEQARRQAVENENKAELRLYASHLASAQREWAADNVPLMEHYLRQCRRDLRGWEHDYLHSLANQCQQVLPGPFEDAYAFDLAFSPDGKRLAIAGPGPFFASIKRASEVQVWNLASGQEVMTLKDTWGNVAFSPDGTRLASAWYGDFLEADLTVDGRVKIWDAANGKEILTLKGHKGAIGTVAFSPDGKRLASVSSDRTAKLWDLDGGKEIRTIKHQDDARGGVSAAAFSADGKRLATAGKSVKVWDADNGKELLTLEDADSRRVAFSPDGKRLAGVCLNKSMVKVWNLADGKLAFTLNGPARYLAFSPDGKRLAGGSHLGGTVKVWELTGGQEVFTLKGPVGPLAFSHDGTRVASLSADGVKIWELAGSHDCLTLAGHTKAVRGLAFSPDGKQLASTSLDHTLKMWDLAGRRDIQLLNGHPDSVLCVALSPDGKNLASSFGDKTVEVWDAASGKLTRTLVHANLVQRLAFSPDGNFLASAEETFGTFVPENCVRVWELAGGKEILSLRAKGCLAFSPDGKFLATMLSGSVKVVAVAGGKEIMSGMGHTGQITNVAFSADGKRLASASRDKTVKIWEVASGRELRTLKGHTHQVMCVAFSPDGKRLASGSVDNVVKLWDAASGLELLTLRGHTDGVGPLTFTPDGKRLASGSGDGTIKIWDASKSMPEAEPK